MSTYAFFECKNPSCRLRFPLDISNHQGKFCPRCGGDLVKVDSWTDSTSSEHDRALPARKISVVLDNIRSTFNVGSIFRTADGVGVEHLYLCGITPTPEDHPAMAKTALGAEKTVSWSSYANALSAAKKLQKAGYFLLALENNVGSIPIMNFSINNLRDRAVGLIVGHERAGVDPGLLGLCDATIALPMVGHKASLNVAVAFGVAVYWLTCI